MMRSPRLPRDTGLKGEELGEACAIPRRDFIQGVLVGPDHCSRGRCCSRQPMPKPAQALCLWPLKISRVITADAHRHAR